MKLFIMHQANRDHSQVERRQKVVAMSQPMPVARWRLRRGADGLRMSRLRAMGTESFTWADLMRAPLAAAQVHVLYFPSRFQLPVDAVVTETLRIFGANTSTRTSVDFWDPTDDSFGEALALFNLRYPPALILTTGLRNLDASAGDPQDSLYCIGFSDKNLLGEPASIAEAVNIAHEILMRCDRKEIAGYIRGRRMSALLRAIGRGADVVLEEFLRFHPKLGLPGGFSLELG
ncbi:hypothetical protein ACGFI3_30125 [Nonomuraea wenchangensis]|uniref:hypothetical protein n=1 Tax=Nonomuraea wenchangensis TaxID=568860 RepID=UPI00371F70FC